MNFNNVIYFIQDLENTGKTRIEFLIQKRWRTEKVIGKKSQSGPIALISFILFLQTNTCVNKCHVMEARGYLAQI